MNKPYFERVLAERIGKRLKASCFSADVKRHEGLIFVRYNHEIDTDAIAGEISKVFGVASISPAVEAKSDMDDIGRVAVEFMNSLIEERGVKTFKVEAKRADKNFPIESPEIARITGAKVLIGCKVMKVDVHNPEVKLYVDLRHDGSFIYADKISGFGGLPLGTNGKGLILLSGGIDSPVAAWMMAKRGMLIEAVHFHSYPYTSPRAQQKVEELARVVASYCGNFRMHVVNLLPVQEEIVKNCPEAETTIHVRRFMMRIAEKIAAEVKAMMLITGENLGQVASQTAEALVVTDASVSLPVMRPLIAMDKVDIMAKAKEIGTFETSIEPYEDCCTVFLPKHPTTKPKLSKIEESESSLDVEALIERALETREIVEIKA
ncbi:MAG: tRNA 4-thiouridine(8) synthase ThiI [Firmicutes bacterium]|nr:tRNA 4-thiouridine(8) synthase ThiI [Bacillota bacterium]